MVCIGKERTGALLPGLSHRCSILVRLRLLHCRLSLVLPGVGRRRVWLGPKPSCDGLAFWQSGSCGPYRCVACFSGMICVGKGLGLGSTFRSGLSFGAFGHVGRRLVTSSPLGGVEGVLASHTCCWHVGQSFLQPFGLALALVFDTHNRWIMASRAGGKTKRQDRNRLGKKRVPCGPLLRTYRKGTPTNFLRDPACKSWLFCERYQHDKKKICGPMFFEDFIRIWYSMLLTL